MRYYESLYIINPNYEQNLINKIMKEIEEKCANLKFKIINHNIWGKKRLAYNIDKHKYGSFILLHFETSEINSLKDYDRFMILQNNVLRNQTILLNEKPEAFSSENIKEESAAVDSVESNDLTKEPKKNKDQNSGESTDKVEVKE